MKDGDFTMETLCCLHTKVIHPVVNMQINVVGGVKSVLQTSWIFLSVVLFFFFRLLSGVELLLDRVI